MLGVGDEELAAVGVGSGVGPCMVCYLEGLLELVDELGAPDGAPDGADGVAALYHEALDVAVEHSDVVVAASAEGQEVIRRAGHLIADHLAFDVA